MSKINFKILSAILILLLVVCLIPSFITRIESEKSNKNVVVSLYHNDLLNELSDKAYAGALDDYFDIGVTTVSVAEENITSMVAKGNVTNIKYNVLRHKYDDESMELARIIAENTSDVNYNSELYITKDPSCAEFLRKGLSEKYSDEEYIEISANNGITVFVMFDGVYPSYSIDIGYEEDRLDTLYEKGFDICLILKMQDYEKTEYLDTLEELIKKYDVKYLSIRKSVRNPENENDGKEHYERISEIIKDNNLTLVVTENANQLSNEKPFGYDTIFSDNSSRVLRSYETYDASHSDETKYLFRYRQYLNSTIDRNIRFITLSQIYLSNTSYDELNEYTLNAAKTYIDKVTSLGYTVNGTVNENFYITNKSLINAFSAAIMVLLIYLMICVVFGIDNKIFSIVSIFVALLAIPATYLVVPSSLIALYPTAWAVIMPCFGMTCVLYFIKKYGEKLSAPLLAVISPILLALIMSLGGIVMSSLLSGIDYYINNDIFRGIKLSLFAPLLYTAVAFYFMFMQNKISEIVESIKGILFFNIKVYWVIIAGIVGLVGLIYIRRSGNVNTISSLETAMRSLITESFAARPRTKEFIVGYPCLVLFVYYLKKTNIRLLQIILACGAAICAASISNSFCHVFTDAATIFMRVVNGLLIAAPICIVVYIGNLILVKIVKHIHLKLSK